MNTRVPLLVGGREGGERGAQDEVMAYSRRRLQLARMGLLCVPEMVYNPLLSFAGAGEVSQTVDMIRLIGY